jgi:hypothetical protein
VKWIEYAPYIDLNDFEKVHVGDGSEYILRSITKPDVYMKVSRESFFQSLLKKNTDELLSKARALVARMEAEPPWTSEGKSTRVKGLPSSIDPSKPPRSYRDAMTREDWQEWGEAYLKEHQGFIEQGTFKIARPPKGAKVLDTTTRADCKVTNGVFEKRKIRLCVCGNQQEEGVHYNSGNLYAPVMKASELLKFD